MTEKRFVLDMMRTPSRILKDGKVISKYDVVVLLNSLSEENEQLRQQLSNYELAKRNLIKRLDDREKEDFERFFK